MSSVIIDYYPLFLIIVGTFLNLLTFIILCRTPFRDTKKHPTIHYMRAIAIFDILMLYGWNLDHYLSFVYGFTLLKYSIISCKFIGFISYFTSQTSAWLRVFVCLERYLTLTHLNLIWFNRSKTSLIIIACIIGVFAGFNFHFIPFACFYKNNGEINANARLYRIYPLWDYINLGVYNCAPFLLMVIFNSAVGYQLIHYRRTTQISRLRNRSISITLVIITSLFIIMTIPAGVVFSFFYTSANINLLHVADAALFTYHTLSFPLYFITLNKFRRGFFNMITCKRTVNRIAVLNLPLENQRPRV